MMKLTISEKITACHRKLAEPPQLATPAAPAGQTLAPAEPDEQEKVRQLLKESGAQSSWIMKYLFDESPRLKATPRPHGSRIVVGLLLLAFATVCGCARVPKPDANPPPTAMDLPRKVAVLPFENHTANPEAGTVLRRMFFNFFSSLNYADMEPAAVDAPPEAGRLVWTAETDGPLPLERLGQLLGVDAVVVGEALALGQTYALVYANQQAGLRAGRGALHMSLKRRDKGAFSAPSLTSLPSVESA